MTTTDQGRCADIARRKLRAGTDGRTGQWIDVTTSPAERAFEMRHSARVWDLMAELRAGIVTTTPTRTRVVIKAQDRDDLDADPDECACACSACRAGNCAGCTILDCDDVNCDHGDATVKQGDDDDETDEEDDRYRD
jgi:hypothetical protein